MFAWLISHQAAVLFSHNKSATNNQPAVLFSQNKPAPVISHQPNEQTDKQVAQCFGDFFQTIKKDGIGFCMWWAAAS
jgi:hypothetical protein